MWAKIKFRIKLALQALTDFGVSLRNALKISRGSSGVIHINDTSHTPPVGRGFFSFVREVLYLISVNGEKDFFVDYRNTIYNDSPDENMWEYCFEPVLNNTASKKIYRYFFLTKAYHSPYSELSHRYRKLFHEVFNDRIRIKKELLEKTEKFYQEHLKGKKCLGVQYRGAADTFRMTYGFDKPDPHFMKYPLKGYIDKINLLLDRGFTKIFLATDDLASLEEFKKHFGDKLAVYSTKQNITAAGIRFMTTDNRRILAEEVLIDCLLLSKCDYLLCGASNVPTVASYLNPNMPVENVDVKPLSLARKIIYKILYI